MRRSLLLISVLLGACGPAPVQPERSRDPTAEAWYGQAVNELATLDSQAKELFERGKSDEAAALIQKGEPLSTRLLSVPKPTLAATEAASDLDQLYGRMLLSNKNYGWARLFFQKNLARWKLWQPRTSDTARRLQEAESGIADCDRHMAE